jgi:hypothetical protein
MAYAHLSVWSCFPTNEPTGMKLWNVKVKLSLYWRKLTFLVSVGWCYDWATFWMIKDAGLTPGTGHRFFCSPKRPTGYGAHRHLFSVGTGTSLLGTKPAREWNWPLTSSSVKFGSMWSYTSIPPYTCIVFRGVIWVDGSWWTDSPFCREKILAVTEWDARLTPKLIRTPWCRERLRVWNLVCRSMSFLLLTISDSEI